MDDLEELKKIFKSKKRITDNFGEYGKIYHHTNENLKSYIPDLHDKSVLTVSSSGDHLLNMMCKGSFNIDTFDINRFSPLYQNLKLYSIRFLNEDDSFLFLNGLDNNLYFKFNDFLPKNEKSFFDYVFQHDLDEISYKLFYLQKIDNFLNNCYFDLITLRYLKFGMRKLVNTHYYSSLYQLFGFLNKKYDYIFLSNISQYQTDCNKFFGFLNYLKYFLTEEGKIYYAYLYEKEVLDSYDGIRSINDIFYKDINYNSYRSIIDKTDFLSFNSAEYPDTNKDSVLILRK